MVQRLEERICALTGIPVDHGEPLQMLHYGVGGEYLAHQDFFEPKDPGSAKLTQVGGQRVATLVMYLNEVAEGGSTDFPELELSIKPKKGSAVYFEYHNEAGQIDTRCLHAGMPVARGDKSISPNGCANDPTSAPVDYAQRSGHGARAVAAQRARPVGSNWSGGLMSPPERPVPRRTFRQRRDR